MRVLLDIVQPAKVPFFFFRWPIGTLFAPGANSVIRHRTLPRAEDRGPTKAGAV